MIIAWRKKFFIQVIDTRDLNCWMVLHAFLLKIPCISSHQVFCFSEATTLSSSLVLFDVPQSKLTPSLKKVFLYFYLCVYLCIKYISIFREDIIIPSLKDQPLILLCFFVFFLLYHIVLVLPYINMNPPRVYTCSPSWAPFPPPSPYHPSGSSQCTSPQHPVSYIEPGLAIHFIYDIIPVSMPFSQIIPPLPSPTESIRLFYTSVSLLLSSYRVIVTIFLNSIYMR